jgi:hypothetical protein
LLQKKAVIMVMESSTLFIAVNNTIFPGKWAMRLKSDHCSDGQTYKS